MRLLYAVHGYKPAFRIGGPAVSVPAVAERLVQRGHEVTIVTTDRDLGERLDVPLETEVDVNGVKVWYFPTAPWPRRQARRAGHGDGFLYAPSMAPMLARHVASMDAVHTHLPFIYPTYAAARAAFGARKPLFYHQRGVLDPRRLAFRRFKKTLYLELVEKPILRRAAMLIGLTGQELDVFRAMGLRAPCRVVPNGVELPAEQSNVEARAQRRWGIDQDAQVVLFLGRIHVLKGVRLLLDAFSRARNDTGKGVLVLAGPDEGGEVERLQASAERFGTRDAVLFAGAVDAHDKALLFARSSMFCLPSVAEGFSMAVLEALASRVPVLISPGCNFPEVEKVGAGWVVGDDVGELARAMQAILVDDDLRRRMGQAGRQLVEHHYSWDRIVDMMEEAYRDGIDGWRRRS